MNYLQARKRISDGRWAFTCRNDERIWPVGYCASGHDHETREEAEECYGKYLIETQLTLDGQLCDQMLKCKECGAFTDRFAEIDGQMIVLCDAHRNLETVKKHWTAPTEIIRS